MNKGTPEGTEEEINLVRSMNNDKSHSFWKVMDFSDAGNLFAVHIISHKRSNFTGRMIKPKADAFIAKGSVPIEYLESKGFYLNEKDMVKYCLKPLEYTGISIKREDSKNYQILKMCPNTLNTIFGSYELGAGASIYCQKKEELCKNDAVLKGWKTNWRQFEDYFKSIESIEKLKDHSVDPNLRLFIAKRVKDYATRKIAQIIENRDDVSAYVFLGKGNFDEPFCASWFYEKGSLKKAGQISFYITTGSGRSKGDYTIVVKPKT